MTRDAVQDLGAAKERFEEEEEDVARLAAGESCPAKPRKGKAEPKFFIFHLHFQNGFVLLGLQMQQGNQGLLKLLTFCDTWQTAGVI